MISRVLPGFNLLLGSEKQPRVAREEEADAVVEAFSEGHLGNGGIDRDLQLRPIDLLQGPLDTR